MTYLEVSVALVVFAIALAGLCPLMLMQLKLLRKLESPDVGSPNLQIIKGVRMVDGAVYVTQGQDSIPVDRVVQPQPDAWVRRLGLGATIQASVAPQTFAITPTEQVVAVGDPGFAAIGWTPGQDPAQTGSGIFTRSPTDLSVLTPATWDFTGVAPGYYRVLAGWPADPRNATGATYTLATGGVALNPAPPADQSADPPTTGLGVYYLNGSLHVELAVIGTGRVVADSIRIVPLNQVTIRTPVAATSTGYQVSVGAVPR